MAGDVVDTVNPLTCASARPGYSGRMTSDIAAVLALLEYPRTWLESGFIDPEFIVAQAADYEARPVRHIEHYKWAAYLRSIELLPRGDRGALERWMMCLDADPNPHLFKGAVRELLRREVVPASWLLEFGRSRVLGDEKTARVIRAAAQGRHRDHG